MRIIAVKVHLVIVDKIFVMQQYNRCEGPRFKGPSLLRISRQTTFLQGFHLVKPSGRRWQLGIGEDTQCWVDSKATNVSLHCCWCMRSGRDITCMIKQAHREQADEGIGTVIWCR